MSVDVFKGREMKEHQNSSYCKNGRKKEERKTTKNGTDTFEMHM